MLVDQSEIAPQSAAVLKTGVMRKQRDFAVFLGNEGKNVKQATVIIQVKKMKILQHLQMEPVNVLHDSRGHFALAKIRGFAVFRSGNKRNVQEATVAETRGQAHFSNFTIVLNETTVTDNDLEEAIIHAKHSRDEVWCDLM